MGLKIKSALILIILFLLIPLGNYFSIPLFLGVDFILGNIAVLMIAFLYHPVWALAAGLISGISFIPIWHHPWAIPVFAAEAFFVSLVFYYRKRGGPVLLTLIYWLIIGIPLGAFMYTVFLKLDRPTLIMVLLKQSLNSFFSSSVASALLFLPVLRDLSERNGRRNNRFYNLVSSTMIIAVMMSILSILVIESRNAVKVNLEKSREQLLHSYSELDGFIGEWTKVQQNSMNGISRILTDPGLDHSVRSDQKLIELYLSTQGYFEAFILYDDDFSILASVPPFNQFENLSPESVDSDRLSSFGRLHISSWGVPYLSVSMKPGGDAALKEMYVTGYQRVTALKDLLLKAKMSRDHNLTLLDENGTVIVSTLALQTGMDFPPRDQGEIQDAGNGVKFLYPLKTISKIHRLRESRLILERSIGRFGWTVSMEYTTRELMETLTSMTNRNLLIAALCFLLINIILLFIARRMTLILDQLIRLSAGQMYGLEKKEYPWPESSIQEFSLFSKSLKEIMEHQRKAAGLLHDQNEKLSQMNTALVNSEEHLRTTLNSISDGIVVIDNHERVSIINPVALKMTDRDSKNVIGEDIDALLKLREVYTGLLFENPFSPVIRSGKVIEPNIRYTVGDEAGTVVTLGAAPIRINRDDRILGAVIVLRDMTDEKKLEDQLRQSQKMEIVGQLAGGIAHDFNNLLGGMQGTVHMMELDLGEYPGQTENMSRLLTLVKRASDLTMKLLSFSRKGSVCIVPLDLHTVVGETGSLLTHTFPGKIKLMIDLKASRSVILGDGTEIQRLLMNLCLNARDAMPGGGKIIITTDNVNEGVSVETLNGPRLLEQDSILLHIEDTGHGIDKDILPHIFEPFFTTKDLGQGSGLGLSAVYGSVMSHQGNINVRSSAEGTTFSLFFPLYASEETAGQQGIK